MYLETERMTVRDFAMDDLEDLQAILGDEETMAYSEPTYTRERTAEFLRQFCIEKKGAVAAVLKATGRVIGYILFHELDEGVYEMGWFFNVQTVTLTAHALANTFLPEHPLIPPVLILPALVRVKNQICSVRYLCKRLVQHGGHHAEHRAIRYGIADQSAAVQIENRGQVELLSKQAELRHIRDPFLIRLFGMEIPI